MSHKNNLGWFRFFRSTLSALTDDLRSGTISPTDMVLYLVLRSEAARSHQGFNYGEVSLSIRQIIEITGFSRSTVKRSLTELDVQGYLIKKGIYGKAGVYVARDEAPINDTEVASWDYVPRYETQLIKKLSDYSLGHIEELPDTVSIENLSINIQANNNFYGVEQPHEDSNEGLKAMFNMIEAPETPNAVREHLIPVYRQLIGDLGQ